MLNGWVEWAAISFISCEARELRTETVGPWFLHRVAGNVQEGTWERWALKVSPNHVSDLHKSMLFCSKFVSGVRLVDSATNSQFWVISPVFYWVHPEMVPQPIQLNLQVWARKLIRFCKSTLEFNNLDYKSITLWSIFVFVVFFFFCWFLIIFLSCYLWVSFSYFISLYMNFSFYIVIKLLFNWF